MKILGFVFIGLTLLAFVLFLVLAQNAPMQSDFHFSYTWPYILLAFGLAAGAALILADWNVRRHKNDHLHDK